MWDETDFRLAHERVCTLADELCDGRVVSTLEGGYDLPALAASVAAHVTELMEHSG
jgi:acetoin utilization deacetylase AcuC-like enzyme